MIKILIHLSIICLVYRRRFCPEGSFTTSVWESDGQNLCYLSITNENLRCSKNHPRKFLPHCPQVLLSAAPRKDCPVFSWQLLPVLSWVPSRSEGHRYLLALLLMVRRAQWLPWITASWRDTGIPGTWTNTTLMASHPSYISVLIRFVVWNSIYITLW